MGKTNIDCYITEYEIAVKKAIKNKKTLKKSLKKFRYYKKMILIIAKKQKLSKSLFYSITYVILSIENDLYKQYKEAKKSIAKVEKAKNKYDKESSIRHTTRKQKRKINYCEKYYNNKIKSIYSQIIEIRNNFKVTGAK